VADHWQAHSGYSGSNKMPDNVELKLGQLLLKIPIHDILSDNFDMHFSCFYQKHAASELNALCQKYGSDKGEITSHDHPYPWPSHSYADFIERHFQHCKEYVKRVFECGIGTNNPSLPASMGVNGRPGASLRVWRDYFPNANIVGADIDKTILFSEERITTFYCDQTNPESIRELWMNVEVQEFDLMIDDGLHTFEGGISLLEHSFHKLKLGGLYIIEDVGIASLIAFRQYFSKKEYRYDFVNLYRKNLPLGDNSLIAIRK
jgi:hypothetical protein